MSDGFRVLCVGAGYFAAFHHEAWKRHPSTELTAVVDQDLTRASAIGVGAYQSLADALTHETPDIIDLVVPPPAHRILIEEALRAEPRAIICQKPFGTSLEEARDLARMADDAGIHLIVHENFRFQPWYRKASELMHSGALGVVHQATFRFRTGDGQGPEAYLDRQPYFQTMPRLLIHETGVHWIDTFRYLLGPIQGVYAELRRMNPIIVGEDAGYVVFSFADNVRAVFDGNRLLDHPGENTRLTFGQALIEGTEGTLELSGSGALTFRKFGSLHEDIVLAAQDWPGFAGDCVYALNAHVVAALEGKGTLENKALDYLAVREVEEAIYRSDEEKRWIAL
ncbi:MAG: Gfo/Idh/MocA family oxidoreductase [Pseudomonadota bacterium]